VLQNLGGRDVDELECRIGRLDNSADGVAHAARGGGGGKGFATKVARAAHSGPRAAARTIASPAVYTCALPRTAALRSGAAVAAMITANVSCGRASQACLAISKPQRQGYAVSGMSQVARGQGHRPIWARYMTGETGVGSALKPLRDN
jgi:hypothetical protein